MADNLFSSRGKLGLTVILHTLVCLTVALLTGAACDRDDQAVKWGYDGQGAPEHWAELSEEYATCADGQQQSPVDIAGYKMGDAALISLSYSGDAESVRNDGRLVHVDYASGNTLSVGQRAFTLKSAQFHSPSEHLIDGAELCGGDALGPRGCRRQDVARSGSSVDVNDVCLLSNRQYDTAMYPKIQSPMSKCQLAPRDGVEHEVAQRAVLDFVAETG